jgi:hypothetical protein
MLRAAPDEGVTSEGGRPLPSPESRRIIPPAKAQAASFPFTEVDHAAPLPLSPGPMAPRPGPPGHSRLRPAFPGPRNPNPRPHHRPLPRPPAHRNPSPHPLPYPPPHPHAHPQTANRPGNRLPNPPHPPPGERTDRRARLLPRWAPAGRGLLHRRLYLRDGDPAGGPLPPHGVPDVGCGLFPGWTVAGLGILGWRGDPVGGGDRKASANSERAYRLGARVWPFPRMGGSWPRDLGTRR